jgi:hypothetical protein
MHTKNITTLTRNILISITEVIVKSELSSLMKWKPTYIRGKIKNAKDQGTYEEAVCILLRIPTVPIVNIGILFDSIE